MYSWNKSSINEEELSYATVMIAGCTFYPIVFIGWFNLKFLQKLFPE